MSSSYLSKSKKGFQPKAPARRNGTPSESFTPARSSIESHVRTTTSVPRPAVATQSYTPAPNPSTQDRVNNDRQSTTQIPLSGSSEETATLYAQNGAYKVNSSSNTSLTAQSSDLATVAQRPSKEDNVVAILAPQVRQLAPYSTRSSPQPGASTLKSVAGPTSRYSRSRSSQSIEPILRSHQSSPSRSNGPALKRRKVADTRLTSSRSTTRELSTTTVDVPTTEDQDESGLTDQIPTEPFTDLGIQSLPANPQVSQPLCKSRELRPARRTADEAAALIVDAIGGRTGNNGEDGRTRSKRKYTKSGKKRKEKEQTPEGADAVRIIEEHVRMEDLCEDSQIGRKSARADEIALFEAVERKRKAEERSRRLAGEELPDELGQSLTITSATHGDEDDEAEGSFLGPQTQIINGEIVLVETSTRIDRHAMAEAERELANVEVEEENILTQRVTGSYGMQKLKPCHWNESDTDDFYNALRMFGTDFGIIARLFPGRTRRHVKRKFDMEEKYNAGRVTRTLAGETIPVALEEFQEWTNTTYRDPAELKKDMEEDRKMLEDEQEKEKRMIDDAKLQRVQEAEAEGLAVGAESSAKENDEAAGDDRHRHDGRRKSKKSRKKEAHKTKSKKAKHQVRFGGGEVEVLGNLEDYPQDQIPPAKS
ncbi:Transcription factor TFIIIB component B [Agyrium rufum]|nr:Transcription factor TFIIIB component B [Agyrium rufum]